MAYNSSSSHKPRKRAKIQNDTKSSASISQRIMVSPQDEKPSFPLAAFLWPARGGVSQWAVLPLILMFTGLFKWATGLWDYSGFRNPPMHGDFEAQRHWMELTLHLPVSQWYFYDLDWWGLDYPPLTAYHSWLHGKIGSLIDPSWFDLESSRGNDDPNLKTFMRATVIISEYLVFVPAVIFLLRRLSKLHQVHSWETSVALIAILLQPSTILIDHAHFQYNTVMLGFVCACMACILTGRLLWSCVFFVAALSYKQMTLYYSPAIFSFLLGSCLVPRIDIQRLLCIGLVTLITFILAFAPLLLGALYNMYRGLPTNNMEAPPLLESFDLPLDKTAWSYTVLLQLSQSIHRIFPFVRGLFEDKVANFWCTLHTFHKLHIYSTENLQKASLLTTLASILPPCLAIGIWPERTMVPIALATCAWGFFLFGFQTHEKSVLLPLVPMTVTLAGDGGLHPETRAWVTWANILGSWTMFPLLKRDQLRVPYFVLTLLWGWLMGLPSLVLSGSPRKAAAPKPLTRLLHGGFYAVMVIWHGLEASVQPPLGKPDLWVVANVLVGAAGFGICYLWCLWRLLETAWRRSGLFQRIDIGGKPKAKSQ